MVYGGAVHSAGPGVGCICHAGTAAGLPAPTALPKPVHSPGSVPTVAATAVFAVAAANITEDAWRVFAVAVGIVGPFSDELV